MKIYIYRKAVDCPYEWAEVQNGLPIHPGDLQERVRGLIANGKPFATQADIVLSMLGWMVRRKEIPNLNVVYVKDGIEYDNAVDVHGHLILPLPEDGFESIQEASFYYRYD